MLSIYLSGIWIDICVQEAMEYFSDDPGEVFGYRSDYRDFVMPVAR